MAETVNKIVRQDVLQSALQQVRSKVYNRTETENKIDEKIAAIPAYELPKASATVLGGVKVGTGLAVSEEGVISATGKAAVDPTALPAATKTVKGAVIIGDGVNVDANGKISVSIPDVSGFQTAEQVQAIAQQAASDAKDDLIGGAPATYDTLKEIADYIASHASVETALNQAIGQKADKTTVEALTTTVAGKATKAELEAVEAKIDGLQYMTTAEAVSMVDTIFG